MAVWFLVVVFLLAVVAGGTASIVGFGIGSLLTPVVALRFGTDVAIAAVALPHLAAGILRAWLLRGSFDRAVLLRFGILSAGGGLAGALLFARLAPGILTRILGGLLLLTSTAGLTGWARRWRPGGIVVWLLGALSGFFGGVVGNQGGLRAAALSAFDLAPAAFVATSTLIGVFVDIGRTPVYLVEAGGRLAAVWALIGAAAVGVLVGTLLGERLLLGLSKERFRLIVSGAVGLLGLWFLVRGG